MSVDSAIRENLIVGNQPATYHPRQTGSAVLPTTITRAASAQTYYTIRLLADRRRVNDAFRAYGYFRWLDDTLDGETLEPWQRLAMVTRQQALVKACYEGVEPHHLSAEESILADLVRSDPDPHGGLRAYIDNMMAVMAFDADRRGRFITARELDDYSLALATAVTEALHYFIGHDGYAPQDETRYLAVIGAHITHMLRDMREDAAAGYYNIPREYLEANGISAQDSMSFPYRAWVKSRVELARNCFAAGRGYLARVESRRCRLAGYAYMARFEGVLDAIERDGYFLRADYHECKRTKAYLFAITHGLIRHN